MKISMFYLTSIQTSKSRIYKRPVCVSDSWANLQLINIINNHGDRVAYLEGKGGGRTELGTFEWWISGFMLDPPFFLISRLNNAYSPFVINLQIN